MPEQPFFSVARIAGSFLVLAIIPLAVGVTMFFSRGGLQGRAPLTLARFILERSSIFTAVILTALGLVVLERLFQGPPASTLAQIGAMTYFFGAVLLVTGEAISLTESGTPAYLLIAIYVLLAFLSQAFIGGALLQSNLLPAWIGWTTVLWNLGLLVVLPVVTPSDMYYPIAHHLMPLLIGIFLLWRG